MQVNSGRLANRMVVSCRCTGIEGLMTVNCLTRGKGLDDAITCDGRSCMKRLCICASRDPMAAFAVISAEQQDLETQLTAKERKRTYLHESIPRLCEVELHHEGHDMPQGRLKLSFQLHAVYLAICKAVASLNKNYSAGD